MSPTRVMMVDDDALVLETAAAMLPDKYVVETYTSPTAALDALRRCEFDVLCTDYEMPELNGLALIERVTSAGISLGTVLITGRERAYYRALSENARITEGLPLCVLFKPYPPEELCVAIERAATFARLRRAVRGLGGAR